MELFHGPVRDGKGWDQLAMVIRHDGLLRRGVIAPQPIGKKRKECVLLNWGCVVSGTTRDLNRMLHESAETYLL